MMNRRDFLSSVIAGGAAMAGMKGLSGAANAMASNLKKNKPNMVFILADDLGWAELGCYGCDDIETPNLDRLANEGVRFTHATAYPMCSPARASMITGRHGFRTGIINNAADLGGVGRKLMPDEITVPDAIKSEGYHSAFMGKWHLHHEGYKHPRLLHEHGFDETFMYIGRPPEEFESKNLKIAKPAGGKVYDHFNVFWHRNGKPVGRIKEYDSDVMTKEAVKFIKKDHEKPFLLWMPYVQVHGPFQAPERWVKKYPIDECMKSELNRVIGIAKERADIIGRPGLKNYHPGPDQVQLYRAMVSTFDENIGQIMDALEEEGLKDDTLFIFMSDNGPHPVAGGGKSSLTDAGVRVPLIMRWPAKIPSDRISDALVSSVDIFSTFVDAAGAEIPKDREIDGKSLLPVAQMKVRNVRDMCYMEKKGWLGLCDYEWFYNSWAENPDKEQFFRRVTPPYSAYRDYPIKPTPIDEVPEDVKQKFRKRMDKIRKEREKGLAPHLERRKEWLPTEKARREKW